MLAITGLNKRGGAEGGIKMVAQCVVMQDEAPRPRLRTERGRPTHPPAWAWRRRRGPRGAAPRTAAGAAATSSLRGRAPPPPPAHATPGARAALQQRPCICAAAAAASCCLQRRGLGLRLLQLGLQRAPCSRSRGRQGQREAEEAPLAPLRLAQEGTYSPGRGGCGGRGVEGGGEEAAATLAVRRSAAASGRWARSPLPLPRSSRA